VLHLTEIGHFALALAFALAIIQSIMLFAAPDRVIRQRLNWAGYQRI
jgi:hypothetical protein